MEDYIHGRLEPAQKDDSDFHKSYRKRAARELLAALYDNIGLPEEKLRIARADLTTKEDYAGLAQALLDSKSPEDALATAAQGLDKPGDAYSTLEGLYFTIAQQVVRRNPALIDFQFHLETPREARV